MITPGEPLDRTDRTARRLELLSEAVAAYAGDRDESVRAAVAQFPQTTADDE